MLEEGGAPKDKTKLDCVFRVLSFAIFAQNAAAVTACYVVE